MHQYLHEYFWIYIVAIVVLVGAVFCLMPKLRKRLEKIIERGLRGEKRSVAGKNEREMASKAVKNRYKSF
jgi:ABC-type bacteriocin/lantibiotic exporter with double-glycine peptidase domain